MRAQVPPRASCERDELPLRADRGVAHPARLRASVRRFPRAAPTRSLRPSGMRARAAPSSATTPTCACGCGRSTAPARSSTAPSHSSDIALPGLDDAQQLTGLERPEEICDFYLQLGCEHRRADDGKIRHDGGGGRSTRGDPGPAGRGCRRDRCGGHVRRRVPRRMARRPRPLRARRPMPTRRRRSRPSARARWRRCPRRAETEAFLRT